MLSFRCARRDGAAMRRDARSARAPPRAEILPLRQPAFEFCFAVAAQFSLPPLFFAKMPRAVYATMILPRRRRLIFSLSAI